MDRLASIQAPEDFRPGDTIVLPFLIVAAGTIVNLSDGIVSAVVEVDGRSMAELTVGNGITVEHPAPAPAQSGAEQEPHGVVTLGSELTANLPLGQVASLSVSFVNSAGVRMHAAPIKLNGTE